MIVNVGNEAIDGLAARIKPGGVIKPLIRRHWRDKLSPNSSHDPRQAVAEFFDFLGEN